MVCVDLDGLLRILLGDLECTFIYIDVDCVCVGLLGDRVRN